MNRIKNKRGFAAALVLTAVAAAGLIVMLIKGFEWRFLVGVLVAMVLAIVNFILSFTHKGVIEEMKDLTDERDRHIAMMSGQTALQILNYILYAGILVSLVLYAVLQSTVCLAIGLTFCGISIVLFLIVLLVNLYYEKHS